MAVAVVTVPAMVVAVDAAVGSGTMEAAHPVAEEWKVVAAAKVILVAAMVVWVWVWVPGVALPSAWRMFEVSL